MSLYNAGMDDRSLSYGEMMRAMDRSYAQGALLAEGLRPFLEDVLGLGTSYEFDVSEIALTTCGENAYQLKVYIKTREGAGIR